MGVTVPEPERMSLRIFPVSPPDGAGLSGSLGGWDTEGLCVLCSVLLWGSSQSPAIEGQSLPSLADGQDQVSVLCASFQKIWRFF